ncbi:ABC-2 type transporter [Parelaphostrongylus tenuis]|uniref:ABC-2 type transporter n=1 Tax=Parelaphostrongylus tenuis TaxID=148309 RepID=A0AAD5R066_PARTN|nr:ABC-2 type transporter [Parelaphostrongylus tenuis]
MTDTDSTRMAHLDLRTPTATVINLKHFDSTDKYSSPNNQINTKISTESAPSTMFLSWYGICAYVVQERRSGSSCFSWGKRGKKTLIPILKNVYGTAGPGQLVAIMGASGCGKSSMLNVLAHRNLDKLEIHGSIKVNQHPVSKEVMRSICAYVQQDDCFIGSLTVREHLMFNAILRMGGKYWNENQSMKVQQLIHDLGLEDCAESLIGTRTRKGISGGEKKRVAFASEIVTNPPLLLCDEPTSGLDSFLALQVVHVLKKLAVSKSMTIMVTIHQPSSQVFELFDRVYLMAEGRVAFCGNQSEASQFWSELGNPLPENFNPADHYISSLAVQDEQLHMKKSVAEICDAFDKSPIGEGVRYDAKPGSDGSTYDSTLDTKSTKSHRHIAGWCAQFRSLYWRSTMTVLREPTLLKVQLIQSVVVAVLTGLIYLNNSYTQQKVTNINGSLYQMVTNMAFMFQFAVLNHFCSEIHTFNREFDSGLYSVSAYFFAKNLAELPNYTLASLVFASILYWMSRLIPLWDAFVFYLLIGILVQNTAISIGYTAGCIFGKVSTATAVLPIFVVPMMAFGGFFINQASLPIYFYPFKFLSYFGYAFESLVVNEWSHVDTISGCDRLMGCYRNGSDVIRRLSFSPQNMWINVIILFSMIIGIRLIGFSSLWLRAKARK